MKFNWLPALVIIKLFLRNLTPKTLQQTFKKYSAFAQKQPPTRASDKDGESIECRRQKKSKIYSLSTSDCRNIFEVFLQKTVVFAVD